MTTTILPTRNEAWGLFGAMQLGGADPMQSWNAASGMIAAATEAAPEAVRDFLDSRHGRHFADDVAFAQAPIRTMPPVDEDDRPDAQMVAKGFTWKAASGRSLSLSGEINPAFNVVDDGIDTGLFIVGNDTSGTRFRLDADAPLGEDLARRHAGDRRQPEQLLRRLAARRADRR